MVNIHSDVPGTRYQVGCIHFEKRAKTEIKYTRVFEPKNRFLLNPSKKHPPRASGAFGHKKSQPCALFCAWTLSVSKSESFCFHEGIGTTGSTRTCGGSSGFMFYWPDWRVKNTYFFWRPPPQVAAFRPSSRKCVRARHEVLLRYRNWVHLDAVWGRRTTVCAHGAVVWRLWP